MTGTRSIARIAGIAATCLAIALLGSCSTKRASEDLPPIPQQDGKALYAFLLEQIPDVVAQVPCACCGESLKWCYEGGCPPS